MIYRNSKRVDSERMSAEIIVLKDRILGYQETIKGLQGSLKSSEASKEKQKDSYEFTIAEKDAIIRELTNKIAHMAAALSLMVTGNVAINKVRMLITGMTSGQMNPSEGFICKLYKRASLELTAFVKELKKIYDKTCTHLLG